LLWYGNDLSNYDCYEGYEKTRDEKMELLGEGDHEVALPDTIKLLKGII